MRSWTSTIHGLARKTTIAAAVALLLVAMPAFAQQTAPRDPAEPPQSKPQPKMLPRPLGAISRQSIDEKSMRALIHNLVTCGTRLTLSSWTDPKRGIGCGRDFVVARLNEIAKDSGGKLQIVVDKFESKSERTGPNPVHLENVYAILPGTDPKLAKTVFIVVGDLDSRPSNVMDPEANGHGKFGSFRATLLFGVLSGEEQGLLGAYRLLDWTKEQGYTVGAMLDNDIVGADSAPGGPHRVRVFSGNGEIEDADSPARELARAIEEINGRNAIRMIFRQDRYGRGGDHFPFYKAGLPAVRFTEPLEDYNHQHQTPRTENGVEYGDFEKYLSFTFMGNVARDNAEVLRQLSMAPAPPMNARLKGAVTPDAKVSWAAEDDSERAGFEVLWRETTDPRWHVYDFVTEPGEAVLKGVST